MQNADEPIDKTIYVPLDMLAGPLTAQYAHLSAGYDPRREVVVIFIQPPASVTAYKGSMPGRQTPPEACQRLGAEFFGDA